jgi:hypothetical protein
MALWNTPWPEEKTMALEQVPADKTNPTLTLDLQDPTYQALAHYAGRIGKLLTAPAVTANSDLAATLDDFLGAIYAFIFAKQTNFTDRLDRCIDINAVKTRAGQLAAYEVRVDGLWMGGFHFNSALFRIAAVYHRILQIVTGKDGNVPDLQTEALSLFGHWMSIRLHKAYSQVNELKHEPQGIYYARLVSYREGLDAIGDLLDLTGAWTASQGLAAPTP